MSEIAKGYGNRVGIVAGLVEEWDDSFIDAPNRLKGKIIYIKPHLPLYIAAMLIDYGAKAVLISEGGRNYHPLIMLGDGRVPAIGGVGVVAFAGNSVVVDSMQGMVFDIDSRTNIGDSSIQVESFPECQKEVYVNVGYPTAIKRAAESGADGIGLLRTEFIAVGALSRMLHRRFESGETVLHALQETNEADVVYRIAGDVALAATLKESFRLAFDEAVMTFSGREIIVRTLDIARSANDPMGNRGIRRCIGEGGHTIRLIVEALIETLGINGDQRVGIILPLVSHYSQISAARSILRESESSRRSENATPRIRFGWEIEQPAAALSNEIWIASYIGEAGCPPDYIGIGTNDLTQFTLALGRDSASGETQPRVEQYLRDLYDEKEFPVIRQVFDVARECKRRSIKLFILGQAAADPRLGPLFLALGIIPSVEIARVGDLKRMVANLESLKTYSNPFADYLESIVNQYPPAAKAMLRATLKEIFSDF